MNITDKDLFKNYSLSFKDSKLENKFLSEFFESSYITWKNHLILALILFILIAILLVLLGLFFESPFISWLRNILFLMISGVVWIGFISKYIAIRFIPVKNMVQLFLFVEIVLGWFYAYIFLVMQNLPLYCLGVLSGHLIVVAICLPVRFVHLVVSLNSLILGTGFILLIWGNASASDSLFLLMMLIGTMIFCLFGAYNIEKIRRKNFYQENSMIELNNLLKKMFGRYLSTEVMNSLIENPSSLELGGERKRVSIMMTDLRGFTAFSERLQPEQVLQVLNSYFEVMVEIILKYRGTISQFIGDAILVIFGAPQEMKDKAKNAVACAIDMQNAMKDINCENVRLGLPELEMGIGINDAEVIVGNIGSSKRSSYTVIGSGVNMASRIESYTVGGQILISESVAQEVGGILKIDNQMEFLPKGGESAITVFEISGIGGSFNLVLEDNNEQFLKLLSKISITYSLTSGKNVNGKIENGIFIKLSKNSAIVKCNKKLNLYSNIKINLLDVSEVLSNQHFYGKIVKSLNREEDIYCIRFTALPPMIDAYLQAALNFDT